MKNLINKISKELKKQIKYFEVTEIFVSKGEVYITSNYILTSLLIEEIEAEALKIDFEKRSKGLPFNKLNSIQQEAKKIIDIYMSHADSCVLDLEDMTIKQNDHFWHNSAVECAKIHIEGIIDALNEAAKEFDTMRYIEPTLTFYEQVKREIENYKF
jgi:hypothetical protein